MVGSRFQPIMQPTYVIIQLTNYPSTHTHTHTYIHTYTRTQVSSTQKLSRYIPPDVQALIDTLAERREELDVAALASLQSLCKNITDNHQRVLDAVSRTASHLDALLSLAVVANHLGYVDTTPSLRTKYILQFYNNYQLQLTGKPKN